MSNAFSLAKFSRLLKSANVGKQISIDSAGDPVLIGGAATAVGGTSTLVGSTVVARTVQLSGVGPYTVTLPAVSELGSGQGFGIICTASGTITVQRQGTDQIYQLLNNPVNSFTMTSGDFLWIVKEGSTWNIINGSTVLQYTPVFGVSLVANGYQKLPGGLIIQWGRKTTTAATGQSITWPIAFPNACLSATGTSSNADENYTVSMYSATTTGALTKTQNGSSGAMSAGRVDWIAIGY